VKNKTAIVPSEKFDQEPEDGIQAEVFQKDLAVHALPWEAPGQEGKEEERANRFVNLSRMERYVERHAYIIVSISIRKGDAPR
jgi:hypothetical protein